MRVCSVAYAAPIAFLAQLLVAAAAQSTAPWRDPSPHQIRFVTVDTSVRLEVLDWGGSGRALVFIGCYLTGHVYDDIAPRLTDQFHVYAITRRGVGASDHAPTGYSPSRRADDVLEVIEASKMNNPILVGNSCGGDILHTLGARNPERLAGLVYLDAAEDPTLTGDDYPKVEVDMANLPARVPQPATPVKFPEADVRHREQFPLNPAIRRAIVEDNRVRPEYARIRVPVLAIYRTMTMEQVLKEYPPKNDLQRAAVEQGYASLRAMLTKWQQDLLAGVPNAKIVELPGANLYMFLSNEADVIRELRAFAATLRSP
jgi:pimeloyl-ACP methyl ester carboxylesterase